MAIPSTVTVMRLRETADGNGRLKHSVGGSFALVVMSYIKIYSPVFVKRRGIWISGNGYANKERPMVSQHCDWQQVIARCRLFVLVWSDQAPLSTDTSTWLAYANAIGKPIRILL